jgi:uncharacterized ferritin-like protein (DUF455 family)
MTKLDPKLFAEAPVRDERFRVVEVWSEMENIYDDAGKMKTEFLHRQMHEEVNGLEIAARNLTDFPEADWELRMSIARQCWDEARHVDMFRHAFEARQGTVGEYPVLCFEYRMLTKIDTLVGRLAIQNRSFEAAGIQAIGDGLEAVREAGEQDLVELFDAQLPDEIQHVRYANKWIKRLSEREPRTLLDIVRAVSQANAAFAVIAGDAAIPITLDEQLKDEAGFFDTPSGATASR